MVKTNPMRIKGKWEDGYVLDYQTLSSTYLGDNQYAHPVFDTKRTELGELLYRLKYRSDCSVVDAIVEAACDFLAKWRYGLLW